MHTVLCVAWVVPSIQGNESLSFQNLISAQFIFDGQRVTEKNAGKPLSFILAEGQPTKVTIVLLYLTVK